MLFQSKLKKCSKLYDFLQLPDRKDRKVIGVMGVDFSLNYLYARLQALYPNCRMRSG